LLVCTTEEERRFLLRTAKNQLVFCFVFLFVNRVVLLSLKFGPGAVCILYRTGGIYDKGIHMYCILEEANGFLSIVLFFSTHPSVSLSRLGCTSYTERRKKREGVKKGSAKAVWGRDWSKIIRHQKRRGSLTIYFLYGVNTAVARDANL
jgi:hypothetical protein